MNFETVHIGYHCFFFIKHFNSIFLLFYFSAIPKSDTSADSTHETADAHTVPLAH